MFLFLNSATVVVVFRGDLTIVNIVVMHMFVASDYILSGPAMSGNFWSIRIHLISHFSES